ncbi:MAG: hypothetical protein KC777_14575, partial [Cyanobacteria bacterium HKST-UBA02]|nr:hypothetical protein [Cyanobacteria bacterium HKST-UBA02]
GKSDWKYFQQVERAHDRIILRRMEEAMSESPKDEIADKPEGAGAPGRLSSWVAFRASLRRALLEDLGDRTRYDWIQVFGAVLVIGSFLILAFLVVAHSFLEAELVHAMGLCAAANVAAGAIAMSLSRWGIEDVELLERLKQIDDPLVSEALNKLGFKKGDADID